MRAADKVQTKFLVLSALMWLQQRQSVSLCREQELGWEAVIGSKSNWYRGLLNVAFWHWLVSWQGLYAPCVPHVSGKKKRRRQAAYCRKMPFLQDFALQVNFSPCFDWDDGPDDFQSSLSAQNPLSSQLAAVALISFTPVLLFFI